VAGNSRSRFIVLGLQALPLLQDGHEVRSGVERWLDMLQTTAAVEMHCFVAPCCPAGAAVS
jgi:hypothetical protein